MTIRTRLATLLAIAGLVLTSLGFSPAPAFANQGSCANKTAETYNGMTNSGGLSRTGVKAFLEVDDPRFTADDFDNCINGGNTVYGGGVAAYVELSPVVQPSACLPTGCAIRFGIIECIDTAQDPIPGAGTICHGLDTALQNRDRVFLQILTCQGTSEYTDYGVHVPGTSIEFSMYENADHVIELHYGGGLVDTVYLNTKVACWYSYGSGNKAVWMGRKYDAGGDSLGRYPTPGANFIDARYGLLNGGWWQPSWGSGATTCQYQAGNVGDACWTSAYDNMYATTN